MIDRRTAQRAQLILVGSVALAIVILALALVMNSLVAVEANAPGKTADRIDETQKFDDEARRGIQSLVLRINHQDRNATGPDVGENLSTHLSSYSQVLAETYASSQSAFVNVSYHNDSSVYGHRIVQAEDGIVKKPTSGSLGDWAPVPHPRSVGWFTMNMNVTESNEERFYVNATGDDGEWVNVSVNQTAVGELTFESESSFTTTVTSTCEPPQSRALIDYMGGETLASGCQFVGFEELDQPMTVSFANGTNVIASYELAVNESTQPMYHACHSSSRTVDRACLAPAVWTANVTTTFQSERIQYRNRFNVSVYDP